MAVAVKGNNLLIRDACRVKWVRSAVRFISYRERKAFSMYGGKDILRADEHSLTCIPKQNVWVVLDQANLFLNSRVVLIVTTLAKIKT
jgi:hypothetical protein